MVQYSFRSEGKAMTVTCVKPVADLGKFSQFHAVFRKIWQNHMLASPRGLAPPPTGNPGSAPVNLSLSPQLHVNSSGIA